MGLQRSPEHNGKVGVLGVLDAAKGRWLVTVPGPSKMMLKPANLRPAAADVVTPPMGGTVIQKPPILFCTEKHE